MLLFAFLLSPAMADAKEANGSVTVFESSLASAVEQRCLTRIREELLAGGFEVDLLDSNLRLDPISIGGALERLQGSVATIALFGNPETGPSELWILDRVGRRAEVRQIPVPIDDPEHAPQVLAIRTIELLRASALQLLVESNQPPPAPPPVPSPAPAAPVADEHDPFAIEVGVGALQSIGGPGVGALPLARLRVPFTRPLFVRLTLAGLGTRPRVTSALGDAEVGQNLGLLELGASFRPRKRLTPEITLGAGAFYARTSGAGIYPYVGAQDSRWALMIDCGAGLIALVGGGIRVALELHAFLLAPHPVVRFSGTDAATIGQPAVLATLTFLSWL